MSLASIISDCARLSQVENAETTVTPNMAIMGGQTAYERVVTAEVAMEMVNRARTKVQQMIYALDRVNPEEAARMRQVGIVLYDHLRSIDPDKPTLNAAIIANWKPLLQNEEIFWNALRG